MFLKQNDSSCGHINLKCRNGDYLYDVETFYRKTRVNAKQKRTKEIDGDGGDF